MTRPERWLERWWVIASGWLLVALYIGITILQGDWTATAWVAGSTLVGGLAMHLLIRFLRTRRHRWFDYTRHSDRTYKPPEPWTTWNRDVECWTCARCGAAAGYQVHNLGCVHDRSIGRRSW